MKGSCTDQDKITRREQTKKLQERQEKGKPQGLLQQGQQRRPIKGNNRNNGKQQETWTGNRRGRGARKRHKDTNKLWHYREWKGSDEAYSNNEQEAVAKELNARHTDNARARHKPELVVH